MVCYLLKRAVQLLIVKRTVTLLEASHRTLIDRKWGGNWANYRSIRNIAVEIAGG